MLAGLGQLRFATGGDDALRQLRQAPADLVLLDVEMPGFSGFELCAAMKAEPALRDMPVIFVTSHDDTEHELAGLQLGAVDFIRKPPRGPLVAARVRTHLKLKALADTLRDAAVTDALTGLSNRRHFDEMLGLEWSRACRAGTSLALLMIDIDHFKAFNDHAGHPAGDECLRAVAQVLARGMRRPGDLLARWGGEEFALLLPLTDEAGARTVAGQMIEALADARIPHPASPVAARVTVSIGGAAGVPAETASDPVAFAMAAQGPASLVGAADRALYQAKQGGRHAAVIVPMAARRTGHDPAA
jgi:diguanylate cyclase (GGDEF)-like protein